MNNKKFPCEGYLTHFGGSKVFKKNFFFQKITFDKTQLIAFISIGWFTGSFKRSIFAIFRRFYDVRFWVCAHLGVRKKVCAFGACAFKLCASGCSPFSQVSVSTGLRKSEGRHKGAGRLDELSPQEGVPQTHQVCAVLILTHRF